MPSYRVVDQPTFVEGTLRQPGEVIDFAGWPGSTLEPEKDDAVARKVKDYFAAHKRDRKLPRQPNLADFAEKAPAKPEAKPVKED